MKNKKVGYCSIAIVVVFVITIVNLFFNISGEYNKNSSLAPELYSDINQELSVLSSSFPVESQNFISSFENALAGIQNLSSVKLSFNGAPIYEFPSETIAENSQSPFIKTYTSNVETSKGTLSLSIDFFMLSPEVIYRHFRFAFFLILIGTLVAAVLLLYLYLFAKKSTTSEKSEDEESESNGLDDDDYSFVNENSEENSDSEIELTEDKEINLSEKSDELPLDSEPNNLKTNESELFHLEMDVDIPEENSSNQETTQSENNHKVVDTVPKECKVYDVQSNLVTQLESELVKASSLEKDLSLIIIRLPSTALSKEIKDASKNLIIETFTFGAMVFDFGEDAFAIIQSGKDLDHALAKAEDAHTKIVENLKINPLIGIASRTLRLISAERLITEAEQAVKHASEDSESPIVAFRVDPVKYRQFLSESNI